MIYIYTSVMHQHPTVDPWGRLRLRRRRRCCRFSFMGFLRTSRGCENLWGKLGENLGKTWKNLENFGKTWKILEKLGKTWKNLENFGKTWKNLEKIGQNLEKLGKTWKILGKFWENLEKLGKTWKILWNPKNLGVKTRLKTISVNFKEILWNVRSFGTEMWGT